VTLGVELALIVAAVLGVVLVAFLVVVTYNDVIGLQRRCQRAWANIDVALKQRHDQLPALVAAVRGAMSFEARVLEDVTTARARYEPEAPIHEQAVVSEATSSAVRSLFAVVEGYPELRSHENVMASRLRSNAWKRSSLAAASSSTSRSTSTTRRSRRCGA
jgi:LemA protein